MAGKPGGEPDAVTRVVTNAAAKDELEVPKASWTDFFHHYGKLKNFSLLLGTAGSWFCLDVAFYGLSLNNGTILSIIGYSTKDTHNVYDFLYKTAVGNLVIVLAGAVPGYWVSVGTIDILGRKKIQMGGFIILTVLFIVMGFAYNSLSSNGLLAIYVLAQFFFNFGESPRPQNTLAHRSLLCLPLTHLPRPQHHHLYRARRSLPHPLPLHLARYLGRLGQGWFHDRPGRHLHAAHPRRHKGQSLAMDEPRPSDLCPLHAARLLHHPPHPRDCPQDPRGAQRRG